MEKKFKLLPPIMPNFITMEMPVSERQDGFKPSHGINVANLSEEEAIEYGEFMKQEFIKHWKFRTTEPKNGPQ